MDKVTVNGVDYFKKENSSIKIAILQRGWVMVGYFSREGNDCTLTQASVIRVWGTTKGLGEIVLGGPTSSTKLDKTGTAQFDYLTVVALLNCEESKWKNAL